MEPSKQYSVLSSLPQSFKQFLKERNIPIQQFQVVPPRYFRIKPGTEVTIAQLAQDIGIKLTQINQHNDFYSIPSDKKIHHSKYYSDGVLYGMDMSSGYAVKALNLTEGLHVLELCCAPGNKLMYIRDLMKGGSVTGVDISIPRMEVTRSLISKYKHNTIRLFCQDAVKFNQGPNDKEGQYDRVLVDAQCTHEGSLKHLMKFVDLIRQPKEDRKMSRKTRKQYEKNNSNPYTSTINVRNEWTKEDFQERFLDKKKLEHLHQLQTDLIENGYNLLKKEGIMVYSTCSFDKSQNQNIVEQFLKRHPDCRLEQPFEEDANVLWQKTDLKFAVRFTPLTSKTGGLFIARIHKD